MTITARELYGYQGRYSVGDIKQKTTKKITKLCFPYLRSSGGASKERLNRLQFGDGYSTFYRDGINTETETYDITTVPLSPHHAKQLFLDLKKFYSEPFEWTNRPSDALYRFYFISPSEITKVPQGGLRSLRFTLENWRNAL